MEQLRATPAWRLAGLLLPALALVLLGAEAFRILAPPPPAELEWYGFGFLDERWRVLRYWGCVGVLVFVPLWVLRDREAWPDTPRGAEGPAGRRGLRVGLALLAYALWLGPPWNLELLARPMEWHEIVHLGPLQSLLVGKPFYTESGTQYGPGLQLLSLAYLRGFGVSLLSFREFWLWTNFAGGLLIIGWLAWLFRPAALVGGLLAFRVLSPFAFLRAVEGGSYEFRFGWASCIRYAGAIHAVLALAWVLGSEQGARQGRTRPGERGLLLASGSLWGVFVLLSQENLGCGVAALALLGGFAWLARAVPPRRLVEAFTAFACGAVLALLPALLYFGSAGELGAFLRRYFEVGAWVARGYSNVAFAEPWLSPQGILYLTLPAAALAVFAVAAHDATAPRRERLAAISAALATLACFATALLRSDAPHIFAAATPAALLVAAAVQGLRAGRGLSASRLVFAAALLPLLLCFQGKQLERFAGDVSRRPAALAAATAEADVVAGRIGYRYDLDAPYSVFSQLSLREFLEVSQRLRQAVGDRPVVISSAIGTRGHWYFFAGLRPWMADPEPSMTLVHSGLRARYLAELSRRGIPCLVATRPEDAEVHMARELFGPRDEWLIPTSERNFMVSCRAEARTARAPAPRG